ncbi:MAG TPA: hypothetical protein VKN76_16285 [Kiloniellaceae bacterium]|nr:hypothetical protein [Kiloniellaceae bacterium]
MISTALSETRGLSIEDYRIDLDSDRDLVFLLRSFRLWLIGLRHNTPACLEEVWNDFANRLGGSDGKEALAALAGCIKVIQLHARRRIRHHPPCCRYVTADEAGFLGVIAACQAGNPAVSSRRAEWLVKVRGRQELLEACNRLARLLQDKGLVISLQGEAALSNMTPEPEPEPAETNVRRTRRTTNKPVATD